VGTGKYASFQETKEAVEASGADVVTVAVRRTNITDRESENLLDYIDPKIYKILPNTAGCYTAADAMRYARLARAAGVSDMVKLEVIGDQRTLFPDNEATLEATRVLVKEGFIVFPYVSDDPVMCKKLEDAGAAAVMPLAAPIGSGLGIRNPYNINIILETVKVPVIVDAGVGTASDAALAMELGVDAVLMNTAIAATTRLPWRGNEAGSRSRPARLQGRQDTKETSRGCIEPAGGYADVAVRATSSLKGEELWNL
jgi:thiazole synthase